MLFFLLFLLFLLCNVCLPPIVALGFAIALGFGKSAPTLKSQIEKQGFKISRGFLNDVEQIRNNLHDLNECGIIKQKELWKCFNRLSKKICKVIVASELKDGEKAIHKETIIG